MSIFRKIAKFVMRYKILILILAFILAFGMELVKLGNEVGMRVLITSIGIDREGGDYVVSAQIFTPQLDETKTQSKFVVKVTAPTIADAVEKMSLKAGRIATAAHCRLIVLGDSLFSESIMKPLNFFMTDGEVGWGAIVVATSEKAEETLNGLNDLEQNASFSWQKFLNANRDFDTITVMSLREAFIRHDQPGSSFLLNVIDVEKPDKGGESGGSGQSESSGGSGGAGSSGMAVATAEGGQNDGGSQGELKMGEKTYVIKDGERVGEVTEEEVRGYSWLDQKVSKATFPVKNVQGGDYNGADVSVRMQKRSVGLRCLEEAGKPVLSISVDATFDESEILSDEHGHILTDEEARQNAEALKRAIEKEIQNQIEAARKKSLETQADFLSIGSRFFRAQTELYDRWGDALFRTAEFRYHIQARLTR